MSLCRSTYAMFCSIWKPHYSTGINICRVKQLTKENEAIDSSRCETDVENQHSDKDYSNGDQLWKNVEKPSQATLSWFTMKFWWVKVYCIVIFKLIHTTYKTSPCFTTDIVIQFWVASRQMNIMIKFRSVWCVLSIITKGTCTCC